MKINCERGSCGKKLGNKLCGNQCRAFIYYVNNAIEEVAQVPGRGRTRRRRTGRGSEVENRVLCRCSTSKLVSLSDCNVVILNSESDIINIKRRDIFSESGDILTMVLMSRPC